MSADNTIAILKTPYPFGVGHEFRVAHCQAIDNIYLNMDGTPNPDGHPGTVVDYFGQCKVFESEEDAIKEAQRIEDEIEADGGYVEYGVSIIELPYAFMYYKAKVKE